MEDTAAVNIRSDNINTQHYLASNRQESTVQLVPSQPPAPATKPKALLPGERPGESYQGHGALFGEG